MINTMKTIKELQNRTETYFKEKGKGVVPQILSLCGKIEMEIAQLPHDEAGVFLEDLGIEEPAMNRLCRVSYDALGLISFLTVGEDEVRAWTISKEAPAVKAAGKIHSDLERGFIRAEVFSFDDIKEKGAEREVKNAGLFRLEGKDYPVQDGDILSIKFSV